ncbi:hypothetical protein [Sandaracinus amylolyticus]|uniref:hypothetical protein n=1 Tax=Sandaracinus amylolyticus TaxID=927083 RepID=UPI00069D00D0|nr:hypothetical protein [Sandaracinus amylolyticus]
MSTQIVLEIAPPRADERVLEIASPEAPLRAVHADVVAAPTELGWRGGLVLAAPTETVAEGVTTSLSDGDLLPRA